MRSCRCAALRCDATPFVASVAAWSRTKIGQRCSAHEVDTAMQRKQSPVADAPLDLMVSEADREKLPASYEARL